MNYSVKNDNRGFHISEIFEKKTLKFATAKSLEILEKRSARYFYFKWPKFNIFHIIKDL